MSLRFRSWEINFHFRFSFEVRSRNGPAELASPGGGEAEKSPMVRQGPVRVKEGRLRTAAVKWVVLTESTLALYKSQGPGQRPRVVISLRDVTSVERTEDNHHDLILEIRGPKRYLLKFKNDNELYDWKDDISRYSVGLDVTLPRMFVHRVHVGFDHVSGKYTGVPLEWAHIVEQPPPYKRALPQVPQANIPEDVKSDEISDPYDNYGFAL
ncbi:hypothetical protein C8J57DRAFT_1397796 [Mycena rebaudengoi]|nr:hypothetical protein C8J57DRAFT_1397796 [Mycena rebaudengoi]